MGMPKLTITVTSQIVKDIEVCKEGTFELNVSKVCRKAIQKETDKYLKKKS